jgi:hypothetical protein
MGAEHVMAVAFPRWLGVLRSYPHFGVYDSINPYRNVGVEVVASSGVSLYIFGVCIAL